MTAETALAIPLLTVVTLALVWMLAFGIGQMRTTDAAREAARALARGDSDADARALVQTVDPGARVTVAHTGDRVVVTVTREVAGPAGVFASLGGTTRAEAVALVEEGAASGPADVPP